MGEMSTFLFARPSFSEGAGRVLDFGNTLSEYNVSATGEQADLIALWMDWEAIASDMGQVSESQSNVKQICSP